MQLLFPSSFLLQKFCNSLLSNTLLLSPAAAYGAVYSEKFMFPKSYTSEQENNLYLILQLHHHKLLMQFSGKTCPLRNLCKGLAAKPGPVSEITRTKVVSLLCSWDPSSALETLAWGCEYFIYILSTYRKLASGRGIVTLGIKYKNKILTPS